MRSSLKIVVIDTTDFPSTVIENGELVVDTNEVSGFAFNKQVNELTDLGTIKLDGALGSSIPDTKKNRIIFSKFLQLNNRCLDFEPIGVQVFVDGMPREEDWMQFVGFNDVTGGIEVELVNSKDHWVRGIEDKTLADVNYDAFSSIEYTFANMGANWAAPAWTDGNFMGYFGLINYGQKRSREIFNGETSLYKDAIFMNDLRPLITVLGTIKQMFCQLGWSFRSPVLESDWGRRLWMYVLKEDYYKPTVQAHRGTLLRFRAEFNPTPAYASWTTNNVPIFNNDSTAGNHDVGGVFTPAVLPLTTGDHSFWTNPLPFAHKMTFRYNWKVRNDTAGVVTLKIVLTIANGGNVYETLEHEHEIPAGPGLVHEIVGEYPEQIVNPGDTVKFLTSSDSSLLLLDGTNVSAEAVGKMYYRGDTISLSDAVHPYPFIDFFKGVIHLVNGRLKTDWGQKEVWLFPEENVTLHDTEEVEGFLRPEVGEVDITDLIVQKSLKQSRPEITQTRFYKLKFKDSTDPYIIDKLGAKETLHSKTVDFGNKFKGEVISENPFFEPTAEAPLFTISVDPLFYPPLDIPIMTDNVNSQEADKREVSYRIGPRIVYAVGVVAQTYYDPITGAPFGAELQWKFENATIPPFANPRYTFPYVTQLSTHNINSTDDQVNQNVVYGDRWFDMYSMFHQKQILDTFNLPPIEFLMVIDSIYFNNEDFRTRKYAMYNGQPLMLIPDSIRDFRPDAGTPTPATFRIDRFVKSNIPCSCQFKACTFFMDIRYTIDDATISALRIISLKVDGVEYVGSPVSLGPTVNIESISGINYVTNLRDAINGIAAPWFTALAAVNPSGNQQPTGKKGKYIRFEWPGCQTFELIIDNTITGENAYRYNVNGYWEWDEIKGLWSRVAERFPYSDFKSYGCSVVNKSEPLCQ